MVDRPGCFIVHVAVVGTYSPRCAMFLLFPGVDSHVRGGGALHLH